MTYINAHMVHARVFLANNTTSSFTHTHTMFDYLLHNREYILGFPVVVPSRTVNLVDTIFRIVDRIDVRLLKNSV